MQVRFAAAALMLAIALAGCGYVGPVVPPSPQIPASVTDLTAVEQGDRLMVNFSTPVRTTDNLNIRKFSTIELRIGPESAPFDFNTWAASAREYDIAPPEVNDPDDPRPIAVAKQLDVKDFVGKHVAVAVRTSEKNNFSAWSNRVVLDVVPPLKPPHLQVDATSAGYKLTWTVDAAGPHYDIYRKGSADSAPASIGTAETSSYVDTTAQWNTPYQYSVVAVQGRAESLPSNTIQVNHANTFAPSVPASITALAAPTTVEISWQRSPESSLKGYFLYRSTDNGPFEKQGDLTALPTYTDKNVEHGKTYRYEVSAVSQGGVESEKSSPSESVTFP